MNDNFGIVGFAQTVTPIRKPRTGSSDYASAGPTADATDKNTKGTHAVFTKVAPHVTLPTDIANNDLMDELASSLRVNK